MPLPSQLHPTTSVSLAAESPPVYRRGDPLDIPLIDNHLAVQLLFPRIVTAIRWVLPKLYLDWTTGRSSYDIVAIDSLTGNGGSHDLSGDRNPFWWKRLVEIVLHSSLLLGSSRLVQGRAKDGCFASNFWIQTPAMKNLGLFLSPTIISDISLSQSIQHAGSAESIKWIDAIRSRIHMYFKLVMLVAVTVIGPRFYEEIKHRRQQQLRGRDMPQLSRDIPLIPRTSEDNAQQQQSQFFQSRRERERATIDRRAKDRKSRVQAFLIDAVLGTVEIFIPPLRLINYLSYLWGMSSTPDLGMRLTGLEYVSRADSSWNHSSTAFGDSYHRHANFHYEALRTASAAIPPRGNGTAASAPNARQAQTRNSVNRRSDSLAQGDGSGGVARTGSWLRKRALSVLGVIEEKNMENAEHERFRYE
ncbi:hypothetical protein ACHAW6_003824 [Cyclotella cf. meneghiniana]